MKKKDILTLLIPSLIVVILWVIFSVYHNYINTTIPSSVDMQILSINPNFDTKTIDALKQRSVVAPIYQTEALPTPGESSFDEQSTISPSITPAPLSTQSGTQASQGGILNP